jgi:hypothetical protein
MKPNLLRSLLALCLLATINTHATVLYVDVNSANPTPPFTNWITAATNIQAAVDAAVAGDQILVANGVYKTGGRLGPSGTNRVMVTKAVAIQSVHGPDVTIIQGYQVPGTTNGPASIRCIYLASGASLSGFTLTNGATMECGGGARCLASNSVLTNCVVIGNSAAQVGGGVFQGTVYNSVLVGNYGSQFGGGADSVDLNNCILAGNSTSGGGGGASYCTLRNCTVVGNSAFHSGGGVFYAPAFSCIVYFNSSAQGPQEFGGYVVSVINCCAPGTGPPGTGNNITNSPSFVNTNGWSNLRLESNSPCINAGRNDYVMNTTDLDGNPRIVGGTVDIGAYEFQSPVSKISYAWLQQYHLIPDAAVDSADGDADGHGNWQEWKAGTVPTDASSVLRLLTPTNSVSGVTVSWQSVGNRSYFLERATTLGAASPFSLLTSNIVGQAGTTTFTDTNAIGDGPFFYRVGVQ